MMQSKKQNKTKLGIALTVFILSITLTGILYALDGGNRNWLEVITLWIIPSIALLYGFYELRPQKTDTFGRILYFIGSLISIVLIEIIVTYFMTILSFAL